MLNARARCLALLVLSVLLSACATPTDVAAWVRIDAGTTEAASAPQPAVIVAAPAVDAGRVEPDKSGTDTAAAASSAAAPENTDTDTPGGRGASGGDAAQSQGNWDGPGADLIDALRGEDSLWVRGWPLSDWSSSTQAWPLEVGLSDFFGNSVVDMQAAVWVSGDEAAVLAEWWSALPVDGPEMLQLDEQRFVVTEDANGVIYVVTADRPPDGTSSYLPIPEGFDRG